MPRAAGGTVTLPGRRPAPGPPPRGRKTCQGLHVLWNHGGPLANRGGGMPRRGHPAPAARGEVTRGEACQEPHGERGRGQGIAMSATIPTRLTEALGCRYPIVSAGMGGPARSELAAAVSEAGGFGLMGMIRESPEFI